MSPLKLLLIPLISSISFASANLLKEANLPKEKDILESLHGLHKGQYSNGLECGVRIEQTGVDQFNLYSKSLNFDFSIKADRSVYGRDLMYRTAINGVRSEVALNLYPVSENSWSLLNVTIYKLNQGYPETCYFE